MLKTGTNTDLEDAPLPDVQDLSLPAVGRVLSVSLSVVFLLLDAAPPGGKLARAAFASTSRR